MIARKCKIPLKEKVNIINQCLNSSRESVAQEHLITTQSVDYIVNNSEKFINALKADSKNPCKGLRNVFPLKELEEEVSEFILKLNNRGITVHGEEIRCFALKVAGVKGLNDFKASKGWLHNFCQRKGIRSLRLNGKEGVVDREITEKWFKQIKEELDKYPNYLLLNADETSIEYHNQSNYSYIHPDGGTKNIITRKERITLFFCVSSKGEKFKTLVIGKSVKPRCFKDKPEIIEKINYRANKNAWMTSKIFTEWLTELDNLLYQENRKAILFVDNFSGHSTEYQPTNIVMAYLPPNTTSVTQPLDAGIIAAIKFRYKKILSSLLVDKYINSNDENDENDENTYSNSRKINLVQALEIIVQSFEEISEKTINNCFKKCNLTFEN